MRGSHRTGEFIDLFTRDFSGSDFQRLFTHDTREAYRFFSHHIDEAAFNELSLVKRLAVKTRLFFLAFTVKLSPARRALFGLALVAAFIGALQLFDGFGLIQTALPLFPFNIRIPRPVWADGTLWLLSGFVLINLLVLLEVADRLTLKNELEVARDIQLAMLPHHTYSADGVEAEGWTRPANTCQGRSKIRPRWRRKTRPPGRWAECLSAVVRTGWSGVWDRPWGGLRRSGNPCAQPRRRGGEASGRRGGRVGAGLLAVFEAVAVAVELEDVDVMGQPFS